MLFIFLLIYGIYVGFTCIVLTTTISYLTAYIPTASFYKSLSDVLVAISGLYANREMVYYTHAHLLFYFNETQDTMYLQ